MARRADEAVARRDKRQPFAGVPVVVKESFGVAGRPCTWGVPALKNTRAKTNSIRNTSGRWKPCRPSTKSLSIRENQWSVWMRNRWCCTLRFAPRNRLRLAARADATVSAGDAERRTFSVPSSPKSAADDPDPFRRLSESPHHSSRNGHAALSVTTTTFSGGHRTIPSSGVPAAPGMLCAGPRNADSGQLQR